jgi:hypothetical protein
MPPSPSSSYSCIASWALQPDSFSLSRTCGTARQARASHSVELCTDSVTEHDWSKHLKHGSQSPEGPPVWLCLPDAFPSRQKLTRKACSNVHMHLPALQHWHAMACHGTPLRARTAAPTCCTSCTVSTPLPSASKASNASLSCSCVPLMFSVAARNSSQQMEPSPLMSAWLMRCWGCRGAEGVRQQGGRQGPEAQSGSMALACAQWYWYAGCDSKPGSNT